jgi:hypothetical protein
MTYHGNDYRVAPLSEWLARLTAKGYTVERSYRNDGSPYRGQFTIYDQRQLYAGMIFNCNCWQYSQWACNVW